MNDPHDNAQTDKEILAKLAKLQEKSPRRRPEKYILETASGEFYEGSADHILGIASYINAKQITRFQISEIHIHPITLRTLRGRISK